MSNFELSGLATAIGSMPHKDPGEACELVLKYLPGIPAWPQLPQRSFVENMYFQFRPPFLGRGLQEEVDGSIWVDLSQDHSAELEQLYSDDIENSLERYAIDADRAAGLHTFLQQRPENANALKGQVTGPISLGLTATDQDRRPLLYNDVFADAIARHLRLKASWQERELRALCPSTIIFVDEPYLASIGSAFVSLPRQQAIALINQVLEGISGLRGVHCCGNTDWSLVLETSPDILHFDAYNYGESLTLYPEEVKAFLEQGGVIAWGIVPDNEEALAKEDVSTLLSRLDELRDRLARKGVDRAMLTERCLVTPSCGLGGMSPEGAEKALMLLAQVSAELRKGKQ